MKKSKVNTTHDKNKNDNLSTPSIQAFFKSAPKSLKFSTGKSSESDNTKAVYIEALKKKLQEFEDESNAVTVEQDELPNEVEQAGASAVVMVKEVVAEVLPATQCTSCKDLEAKYKNIKKDYMKMSTNYAELRIKYDDLLATKTYTCTNQSDINDPVSSSDTIFTTSEIAALQCMALDKKSDSTFVLRCLQYAYKNDLSSLLNKTLKGKPESMIISDDGDVAYMPGKDINSKKNPTNKRTFHGAN